MRRWLLYGFIILFSVIWSSGFVAGKIAITELDPFAVLTLRLLLSAALLSPFYFRQRECFRNRQAMRTGITLGILNNAFYLGLTFSALRFIHPELVIVVVSTAPFLTTILAACLSLEPINVYKVAGIATGFTGVLIITGIGSSPVPDVSGIALALIGTVAFSIATVYFQGSAAGISVLPLTFWQSFAGAVVLLPVALLFRPKPGMPSLPTAVAVLYLSVVVTLGGMVLWLFLIRKTGATTASAYHLLNPMFGALLSHFVLSTPIRQQDLVGIGVVTVGLLITINARNRGKNRARAKRRRTLARKPSPAS